MYRSLLSLWLLGAAAGVVLTAGQQPLSQDRALARGERRVALVVGNDAYADAPLRNARNDARAVARALEDVGFRVTLLTDATRALLAKAVVDLGSSTQADDVVLFYFAGHGVQVDGENFLIPSDFRGNSGDDVQFNALKATQVQQVLRRARVSLLILDACRNNPFMGTRGGGGLAAMEAHGSLVAFATGAGQTAADGSQSNGLFTSELLRALQQPGLTIQEVFQRVRRSVFDASGGRQFPAVYDGLLGEFRFRPGTAVGDDGAGGLRNDDLTRQGELLYWSSIKDTTDTTLLNEYLKRYGESGLFGSVARARLRDLSARTVEYRPPEGQANAPRDVVVKRTDDGERFRFDISFTAPPFGAQGDTRFDWIPVYAFQRVGPGEEDRKFLPQATFPNLVGNWKPGERITFTVHLPRQSANVAEGWQLHFGIGTRQRYVPSPNVLIGAP